MNTPSDPRAELARVVELLEKATPGEWIATQFHDIQRTKADGTPGSLIASTSGKSGSWDDSAANGPAIAAAVNFLRKHGASLLSSHGVGGEAVAWPDDNTHLYTDAMDDAVVAFMAVKHGITRNCENNGEVVDAEKVMRRSLIAAMVAYREAESRTLRDAPPPQPRAEGMVLDAAERDTIETLLNLTYAAWGLADNTEDSGGEGLTIERSDFALLEKHLDTLDELPDDQPGYAMGAAAKARWSLRRLLSAAPSEGSASQSATPSDELPELPESVDRVFAEAGECYDWIVPGKCYYTPDQMRAYGQLCRNGDQS